MELDTTRKDGSTLRAHLMQVKRSTGRTPPELKREKRVPFAGQHIWNWFWELDGTRGEGMSGPRPLSFPEIEAWARLTGTQPEQWEVRALKAMDHARLEESARVSR